MRAVDFRLQAVFDELQLEKGGEAQLSFLLSLTDYCCQSSLEFYNEYA